MRIGDWTFVCFLQEETGKLRKLLQPQRGSFRIISSNDPDVTVVKAYSPEEGPLQIHNTLPFGFYWYEGTSKSSGRVRSWVQMLPEDPKQQPDDARSQKNEIPSDQSDSKPDSDSEDLAPTTNDTSAKPNQVVSYKIASPVIIP